MKNLSYSEFILIIKKHNMKNYYCKFILAIIMMVCPVIASADEEPFEVDGFSYNKLSSKTVELVHAPRFLKSGSVIIPSEVTNEGVTYTVTSIGKCAFEGKSQLVSIILPNSITSIGDSAFWRCIRLEEVTMGDNVSSIKAYAFSECTHLSSLTLSKNLESIEQYAFFACDKLETLEIPNGVKKIGHQSFSCIYSLKTLTIPSSLSTIEGYPFIGDYALTSIKVDDGNEYYDSRSNCNALIRKDGDVLIQGCVNTVIPNGIKTIGAFAFEYCPIRTMNIPEGIKEIGYSAFEGSGLVSINIPSSVKSIMSGAFDGCGNLLSIMVDSGNKYYDSRDNCNAIVKTDGDTLLWGCCTTMIPNGIKVIGDRAFYYCKNLKSLTLNEGLTSIGNSAFAMCEELTSVKIPNSVTTIGGSAFEYCESLEYVKLPENLKKINSKLFYGCCLSTIDIPKGVTSIGSASFMKCPLTSLAIPNSVVEICDSAFMNCRCLSSVSLPDGLKVIGERIFYNCNFISSLAIPASVEKISSDAFEKTCLDFVINLADTPQQIDRTTFEPYYKKTSLHVYEGLKEAYEASEWWKEYFVIYDDIPRNGCVTPLLVDGSTVDGYSISNLTTFQLIAVGNVAVNQNMKTKIYADNELIGEADFNDVALTGNIMTINFRSLVKYESDSDDMIKVKIVIEKGSVNVNDNANVEALVYNYNASRSIYESFSTGINTVTRNPISIPRTTKRVVDGRLVIERNGKLYSLDGKAF